MLGHNPPLGTAVKLVVFKVEKLLTSSTPGTQPRIECWSVA